MSYLNILTVKATKHTIGILAGMGPKSTGPFIDQVITQYQIATGAVYDIDFPSIAIYSLPTPFYTDRSMDHTLMKKTICSGLKRLAACDVSYIAIPCVTAHLYFDSLKQCTSVPLLNIIEVTSEEISQSSQKISILATRPTFESLLFQNHLKKMGYRVIFENSWQDKIDILILMIKAEGSQTKWLPIWDALAQELKAAHVDTLLLACTDLNVLLNKINPSFKVVDASLCLEKAVVRKWLEINHIRR